MKIQIGKSLIKWQNQKLKHTKGIEINSHIPDLTQTFTYAENGG